MTSRARSAISRSTSPAGPISPRWRSCSRSRISRRGRLHYTVFARCYVNDAAVMEARNPSYPGWAAEGYLVDHARQRDRLRRDRGRHPRPVQAVPVLSVAYDPWAATQLAQRLSAEGVPGRRVPRQHAELQRADQGARRRDARAAASRMTATRCWSGASAMWSAATTRAPMSIRARPGRSRRSTRPSRSSWRSRAAWPPSRRARSTRAAASSLSDDAGRAASAAYRRVQPTLITATQRIRTSSAAPGTGTWIGS